MGWAAWFRRVLFLALSTPRSVLGPTSSFFARLSAFLPSRRPPHSVRGHGLANRAAKQRDGTVGCLCSFFFCRPADALFSSEPGGGQGNLATHNGTVLYVLSSFLCDGRCFVFSFDMRSRLGTPPLSRDCGLCHLSISCGVSPFVSSPPPR